MTLGNSYINMQVSFTEILESKNAKLKERIMTDPSCSNISNIIFKKMLEEITLDLVAEYHRSLKFGYSAFFNPVDKTEVTSKEKNGKKNKKEKVKLITCPNCSKVKGISTFQSKLAVCMGLEPSRTTESRQAKKCVSYTTDTR